MFELFYSLPREKLYAKWNRYLYIKKCGMNGDTPFHKTLLLQSCKTSDFFMFRQVLLRFISYKGKRSMSGRETERRWGWGQTRAREPRGNSWLAIEIRYHIGSCLLSSSLISLSSSLILSPPYYAPLNSLNIVVEWW